MRTVETALEKARAAKAAEQDHAEGIESTPSRQMVEECLAVTLCQLAGSSFEFAGVLRGIFPHFSVQPIQAFDSGQIRPRARLTFRPAAIFEAAGSRTEGLPAAEDMSVTIDLFDPPVHIAQLRPCLAAKEAHPNMSLNGIGALLGVNHMTAKRAFDYARLMQKAGASGSVPPGA